MPHARSRVKKLPKLKIHQWLDLIQLLIGKHSTAPRKTGKFKGHASTNSVAWVVDLADVCRLYLIAHSRGKPYDENMALASLLGLILSAWYAQVHRAKGMDPNRPLARRKVFRRLAQWKGELMIAINDERIMGKVWGHQQSWNFPFGKGARAGKFV